MVIPRCRSRSMESIVAPTLSLPRTWLEKKDEYQTTKSNAWIYQHIFLEQRHSSQHDKAFLPENVLILISTVTIHNKWKS